MVLLHGVGVLSVLVVGSGFVCYWLGFVCVLGCWNLWIMIDLVCVRLICGLGLFCVFGFVVCG